MSREGKYSKLLDLAAVLLVVAVFLGRHPARVKAFFARFRPEAVSTPTQVGPSSSPKVVVAVSPSPSATPEETVLDRSPGCAHPSSRPAYVEFGGNGLRKLRKVGQLPTLGSPAECYKVGEIYHIAHALHALAPGLSLFRNTGETVKVTRIRMFRHPNDPEVRRKIEEEVNYRVRKGSVSNQLNFEDQADRAVLILEVEYQGGKERLEELGPSGEVIVHFVTILTTRDEFESSLKEGATLIDLRPPSEFAQSHDPRAVNVPYWMFAYTRHWRTSVKVFGNVDRFDLRRLPQDKKKPLIFIGETLVDRTPLRAAILAKMAGWENLRWYRPGEAGRRGLDPATPTHFAGIEQVDASGVEKLIHAGAVPVSVMPSADFKEIAIPGSVSAPYTLSRLYYVPLFPSAKQLKKDEKSFSWRRLPPRSKSLIIYGFGIYDWAPLRVAIWAKKAGWRVYWYRGGVLDWTETHPRPN